MSIALLQDVAESLGPLREDLVFVGGATLGLWLTDPAAPDPRVTIDADVIALVEGRAGYYALGERLRERGFGEDTNSRVICRWRSRSGAILDVMPTDEVILGFSNRWYAAAVGAAVTVELPDGTSIRAVSPPYLLATKIEAFRGRGRDDHLASVDFEDIVRLVDGREELVAEVASCDVEVRSFVAEALADMLADPRLEGAVAGALLPDAASQARRPIVLWRLRALAGDSAAA